MIPGGLTVTDIMPLINKAWSQSSARIDKNKNTIADRGWNPFNRNLLVFPEVCETMTKQEVEAENSSSKVCFPPKLDFHITHDSRESNSSTTLTENTTFHSDNDDFISVDMVEPPLCPPTLNFSTGQAAFCPQKLVQNKDLLAVKYCQI
jgi:hypothetical protein